MAADVKVVRDIILIVCNFFRLSELTARPAACESARLYLDELQKVPSHVEII